MHKPESQILQEIRLALGKLEDVVCWRNNTGVLKDINDRPVQFGLCKGSSDLICIIAPYGGLMTIEVKSKRGRVSEQQQLFINLVTRMGGYACVARSADEALEHVGKARKFFDNKYVNEHNRIRSDIENCKRELF